MDRRTLLRRTAVAGATLAVAGCLRRDREEDALRIEDTQITEAENGNLSYVVTISNVAPRNASGTLYVTSELNDGTDTKVRKVSTESHSTVVVEIVYDVKYGNVSDFSPSSDLRED